jgi:archaemetzincin
MSPDGDAVPRAPSADRARDSPTWREIAVTALDGISRDELFEILAHLSSRTGLACRPIEVAPLSPLLTVPGRSQVDADRLLARLEEEARARGSVPLVGVTGRDIGLPLFTFVFGRARVGGEAALVSTARLRPEHYGLPADGGLAARRASGEILHELGHLAGRVHCDEPDCVMRFAASVEAADLRGDRFCSRCAQGLAPGLARPQEKTGLETGARRLSS